MGSKSALYAEIKELKRIKTRLLECIEFSGQMVRDQKKLRESIVQFVDDLGAIESTDSDHKKSAIDETCDDTEFEKTFDKLVKKCPNKEEADTLRAEIDAQCRCRSIMQYEIMAKMFPKQFQDLVKQVRVAKAKRMAPSLVVRPEQPKDKESKMERWEKDWLKQFRPFTIVDERGQPLPGRRQPDKLADYGYDYVARPAADNTVTLITLSGGHALVDDDEMGEISELENNALRTAANATTNMDDTERYINMSSSE